jgi:hypothetical protein
VETVLAAVTWLVDARALLAREAERQGCQRFERMINAGDKMPRSQKAAKKIMLSAEAIQAS